MSQLPTTPQILFLQPRYEAEMFTRSHWVAKLAASMLAFVILPSVAISPTLNGSFPQGSVVDSATVAPKGPPPDLATFSEPVYPPLPDGWDNNVTLKNLLGTRLFGFVGCNKDQSDAIRGAYYDFNTLVTQTSVNYPIDWTDQAATEFWGPSAGKKNYVLSDETKRTIEVWPNRCSIFR